MKNIFFGFLITLFLLLSSACGILDPKNKGKGFNLFPVEQDKQFGLKVSEEINGNRSEFPQLDAKRYPEVYNYITKIRNTILKSGKVDFYTDFDWKIHVIHDDKTLNAFCTPGGYIYIYTGLLKYLESEDQLAGVLAHEIAHADMRHSTRQMTSQFGFSVLSQILLGDQKLLMQVSNAIIGLRFSRAHEMEADERSVLYLCETEYNSDGASGFFEKIEKEGGSKTPQFLSTHPSPANRVEHFHKTKFELGCSGRQDFKKEYKRIVSTLP
jgi:predicted Zn-dependent protease